MKNRRTDIDLIKGLSILYVVFFHLGVIPSGYLGVDVFFVLAGYFTFPQITKKIRQGKFRYFRFLGKRIMRLLPIILIVSILSLIIGFVFWLPDDYENLSESIVASVFFSNNVLAALTTGNYWDTINEYKPLMHTWYLGILMEFYIVVPLLIFFFKKLADLLHKKEEAIIILGITLLTIFSFLLFFGGHESAGQKFYYFPFRFYELALGGLVGSRRSFFLNRKKGNVVSCVMFFLLLLIMSVGVITVDIHNIGVETWIIGAEESGSPSLPFSNTILVMLTVVISAGFLLAGENTILSQAKILPAIGKRSYSIFVWHQVILALCRYSITSRLSVSFLIIFFVMLVVVTEISYRYIENRQISIKQNIATGVLSAVVVCFALVIYLRAGVVRDIPELEISVNNVHKNMHAAYNERIFNYEKDFPEKSEKENILLIGNSFARDFGNVLLESEYVNSINLSYSGWFQEQELDRIREADRIFVFSDIEKIPDYVWKNVRSRDIIYGIGTKNFGANNGQIYSHRFCEDYFEQTITPDSGYMDLNSKWEISWGNQYVEMMKAVTTKEGTIRVFTDQNCFISQDCRHLTRAGAEYYASILDLAQYLCKD